MVPLLLLRRVIVIEDSFSLVIYPRREVRGQSIILNVAGSLLLLGRSWRLPGRIGGGFEFKLGRDIVVLCTRSESR